MRLIDSIAKKHVISNCQASTRSRPLCGKTETILKRDYWFPKMHSIVKKVVHNCVSCILAEKKHGRQEGWHTTDEGYIPLDTYHIDHLGSLPTTKKQYRHILVIIDSFTKFMWFYASRSGTAEVLDKLRKQAAVFDNPRRIISDRGTSFTSHDFKQYCEEKGIQHTLFYYYRSSKSQWTNGTCESYINSIIIKVVCTKSR